MTRNTTPSTGEAVTHYECRECLARHGVADRLSTCPDCGGEVENLSKPRE
ncbi:rubrerythrin-like domain-containing protein [Halorubrum depositum]|nr:rubrerythrin-like domain-containing protein [Halorubrum depositum]